MINLKDGELIKLLPSPLKDDANVIAISYALKMAMAKVIEYSTQTRLYADLDNVSEEILDYLAVEMNLAFYEQSFSVDLKRSLVKNSMIWYMAAGTRGAVENMITTIFGEGSIKEWYEQEEPGTPGTFDIETEAQLTPDLYERMAKVIERVKNESSHMRYVSVLREIESEWQARFARSEASKQSLTNDIVIDDPNAPHFNEAYIAVGELAEASFFSAMDMPSYTVETDKTLYAHMGLSQFSTMSLVETIDSSDHSTTIPAMSGLTQINKLTIGG